MKGKKCIELLILFITFLLSLKVYSNANATSINIPTVPTGRVINVGRTLTCVYVDPANNTNVTVSASVNGDCQITTTLITNQIPVRYIYLNQSQYYDENYYYSFILSANNSILFPNQVTWALSSSVFNVIDFKKISSDDSLDFCSTWSNDNIPGIDEECILGDFHSHSDFYEVVLQPKTSGNYYLSFGSVTGSPATLMLVPTYTNLYLTNIIEYKLNNANEEMNQKDDEDRSNIESQSSETDDEANEQGDEATQTGTSLFNAFSQLLGALTNVNGNTCTLPAMQVYSLNLGNMNLCQYDIPPQIMALVSVGMVFIIIPLGINLVKRMISLYKEITG